MDFLDCKVSIRMGKNPDVDGYRKPTHTTHQIYNSMIINIQHEKKKYPGQPLLWSGNTECAVLCDYSAVTYIRQSGFTHITVGGAQAWASAGQPTLADRRKWPTPTTTRMGPTRLPLALMRHHKGLQVPIMPLFLISFDSRTSVLVVCH